MKTHLPIKKYMLSLALIMAILGIESCNKEEGGDTTPPGILTVTEIIPTHGGAKITYTIPQDNDILFVKASYITTTGKEVFKVSSYYKDTIELDGFNDTTPQAVSLYVVDRNNNHSEKVEISVTPLISYIYLVQESTVITSTFGGVQIKWENVEGKPVHVKVYMDSQYGKDSTIITSDLKNYATTIRGLDSVNYTFNTIVEDKHENTTLNKTIGTVKPAFEEIIAKEPWTLIPELSVDGSKWEGVTENFWDDVIDTHADASDNSYFIINRDDNGGSLKYPLDIVIDLNKKVILNRLQVWQRAYWYSDSESDGESALPYYYQPENMRKFEIWISNDKTEWTLAGQFDIEDPKDDDGNIPEEKIQEALEGHEFLLDAPTEPFQYMKFSITSSFGSETNVYGSEITIYGVDNVTK